MTVYLLYSRCARTENLALLGVYKKSSYSKAFAKLAEFAEKDGNALIPGNKKLVAPGPSAWSEVVSIVQSPVTNDLMYLEAHTTQ